MFCKLQNSENGSELLRVVVIRNIDFVQLTDNTDVRTPSKIENMKILLTK